MSELRLNAPARGSQTGRPVMVALDLLGRRGALRILWELRDRQLTFRALQAACNTNPGLLNTRLKELRDLRIVDHAQGGYVLTEHGTTLTVALRPLTAWAAAWSDDLTHDQPASG